MTRLLLPLLCLLSFPAYADCGVNRSADIESKEPFAVSVCAHVVGTVCTPDSPYAECQDAVVVSNLAEDDVVIVTEDGK